MGSPNGHPLLRPSLAPTTDADVAVHVVLGAGENGAPMRMGWRAGLVWELDQIRLLLAARMKGETHAGTEQPR